MIWLKTFCTLAEVGHFTKTAEALFITQSGVSQHIKKLEQQLDTDLLLREGKSFSLTDAGIKLHQLGHDLLRSGDDLVSVIKQDDPLIGEIKIASPGSIGLKLYSHLLDIQQRHSALIIDYIFAPNSHIELLLSKREIDIGLVTELSKSSKLLRNKMALEPLVLVTSAKVESVNWETLLSLGFIGHPDGEYHANLLLSANFEAFEQIEQFIHKGYSNQISLILEPVSRGLGFTVLPLHAVNAFHKQAHIKVHTLPKPVSESLYLCVNKHSFQSNRSKYIQAAITDFLNVL
jgi:DNA-binding transcriptional LysR family regulator